MNKFLNALDGSLKYLLLAIVAQFVKFQFFGSYEMSLYFVLRELPLLVFTVLPSVFYILFILQFITEYKSKTN